MHVKINRGNKSKATRKRNLQESLQEFNMQESSNNHNLIETIEIIEAINSTDPKVNDTPLGTGHYLWKGGGGREKIRGGHMYK